MLTDYLCCNLCKWSDKTVIWKVEQSRWYRGSRGTAPLILTLPLDGGELWTSHPGCFTPRNEPGTYCVVGCVGLSTGLDVSSLPIIEQRIVQPTATILTELPFNVILLIFMLDSTAARRKFWVLQEVGISSTSLSTVSGRTTTVITCRCTAMMDGRYMHEDTTTVLC